MTATPDRSSTFGPWLVRVPDWTPPSLNRVMGFHWKRKEDYKKQTADLLGVYARLSGVRLVTPEYRPVRRLAFTCVFAGQLPDPDNLYKITLDALKRCRVIVDDGPSWADVLPPTLQRGPRDETIIAIDDVRLGPTIDPNDDPELKRFVTRMKRKGKGGVHGPTTEAGGGNRPA